MNTNLVKKMLKKVFRRYLRSKYYGTKINADETRRDDILRSNAAVETYLNDETFYTFYFLSCEGLKILIEEEYIGFLGPWNKCPGNEVLINFVLTHQEFVLGGSATSKSRMVEGIHFDRIRGQSKDPKVMKEFKDTFHGADELIVRKGHQFAWFD